MTYCVAMKLDAGLVFASDSRTNAGVDNVSRFEKMHVFCVPGDRVIVALSAGNLSITQTTLKQIEKQVRTYPLATNINTLRSMQDVAELVGTTLRDVRARDVEYLHQHNIDSSGSFIIGGQIAGEAPRLFLVYSEGNFIEATEETPYFQNGEIKYGKPVLDRVMRKELAIPEAVKLTLVSFDSTMRSNISVGLPIDLLVYTTDSLDVTQRIRIDENDTYFRDLGVRWNEGLKLAFTSIPPPWWSQPQA